MADRVADMMWSDSGTARLRRELADFLGEPPGSMDVAIARTAKAAAELAAADELSSRSKASQLEQSRKLADLLARPADPAPVATASVVQEVLLAEAAPQSRNAEVSVAPFAELIGTMDFARDMVARAVRSGAHDAAWGKVKLRVIEEFVECTGCTTLTSIRQADIWKWMRILEQLPANHGKDPNDAE